jgi:hypothetical protein
VDKPLEQRSANALTVEVSVQMCSVIVSNIGTYLGPASVVVQPLTFVISLIQFAIKIKNFPDDLEMLRMQAISLQDIHRYIRKVFACEAAFSQPGVVPYQVPREYVTTIMKCLGELLPFIRRYVGDKFLSGQKKPAILSRMYRMLQRITIFSTLDTVKPFLLERFNNLVLIFTAFKLQVENMEGRFMHGGVLNHHYHQVLKAGIAEFDKPFEYSLNEEIVKKTLNDISPHDAIILELIDIDQTKKEELDNSRLTEVQNILEQQAEEYAALNSEMFSKFESLKGGKKKYQSKTKYNEQNGRIFAIRWTRSNRKRRLPKRR